MKSALVLLLSLAVLQGSCPANPPAKPQTQKQSQVPQTPIHRFIPTHDLGLAFDTQTGQLCKTWDWQPLAPEVKPDKEGKIPQRTYGEFTPTCLSVYKEYPTGTTSSDPFAVFREEDIEGSSPK